MIVVVLHHVPCLKVIGPVGTVVQKSPNFPFSPVKTVLVHLNAVTVTASPAQLVVTALTVLWSRVTGPVQTVARKSPSFHFNQVVTVLSAVATAIEQIAHLSANILAVQDSRKTTFS